jgi:transposase
MITAVERGLSRRKSERISFVGLDEKSFLTGRKAEVFACIMTYLDSQRVIDVARGRSEAEAETLVDKALDPWQRYMVCGMTLDMSTLFEKVARDQLPNADVVFDRFHAEKHQNETVDEVRKAEHARLF